ncbi:hypothetical protein NSQ26_10390 [Bacillus sp. FSL W7-1360]
MINNKKQSFYLMLNIARNILVIALCFIAIITAPWIIIYLGSTTSFISFQGNNMMWRDILFFWDFMLLGTLALGLFLLITFSFLAKIVRERSIVLGSIYGASLLLYLGLYVYIYQAISPKLETNLAGSLLIALVWMVTAVLFGWVIEKMTREK